MNEVIGSLGSHAARELMFTKPLVQMPQTTQLVAIVIFGLGALATLFYAIYVARKTKVGYPIWVILGTLAATPYETFDLADRAR